MIPNVLIDTWEEGFYQLKITEMADPNNRQAHQYVTSTEFNSRFSNKVECYRFLASECKIYLPKPEHVTIWHLRDLV